MQRHELSSEAPGGYGEAPTAGLPNVAQTPSGATSAAT